MTNHRTGSSCCNKKIALLVLTSLVAIVATYVVASSTPASSSTSKFVSVASQSSSTTSIAKKVEKRRRRKRRGRWRNRNRRLNGEDEEEEGTVSTKAVVVDALLAKWDGPTKRSNVLTDDKQQLAALPLTTVTEVEWMEFVPVGNCQSDNRRQRQRLLRKSNGGRRELKEDDKNNNNKDNKNNNKDDKNNDKQDDKAKKDDKNNKGGQPGGGGAGGGAGGGGDGGGDGDWTDQCRDTVETWDVALDQKLGMCEGDCADSDDNCADGLICYRRNDGKGPVPGCTGEGVPYHTYCTDPAASSQTFRLRMWWELGYTWQLKFKERWWCVEWYVSRICRNGVLLCVRLFCLLVCAD